jgi:minor curlin subunit
VPTSFFWRNAKNLEAFMKVMRIFPVLLAAISLPVCAQERSAHIAQIGDANVATITQTAANARAVVQQDGGRNSARVDQTGTSRESAELIQAGDANQATATQSGSGGSAITIAQSGARNVATATQQAAGALNSAAISQTGNDNRVALAQDGGDNQAELSQSGNDNAITATQNGSGNRLIWTQQGNGLSNLGITQSGNQSIQISQTGGGQ